MYGPLLSLLLGLSLAAVSLQETELRYASREQQSSEGLYLPNRTAVRLISFGYHNALSNYIWFHTINYFGLHYRSDKDYQWLAHQCELVTDLNPTAAGIYEFCGSMLAWEAKQPEQGIAILSKAIKHNPEKWLYRYLRGVFYMFFMADDNAAHEDFIAASKLEDAHPLVKRLAAKKLAVLEGPETALQFLQFMIERSKSDAERNALRDRMKEVYLERDLGRWNSALERARSEGKSYVDLSALKAGERLSLPVRDPFGNPYYIEEGNIRSKTERKPLSQRKSKRYNEKPAEPPELKEP